MRGKINKNVSITKYIIRDIKESDLDDWVENTEVKYPIIKKLNEAADYIRFGTYIFFSTIVMFIKNIFKIKDYD